MFDEIVLSCLPVGHTHEDIDQMFSRFSVALRYNDAPSRIALTNVLTAGFKHLNRENVHHLETVANVSDYLNSMKVLNNFDGIMAKRQFRFFLEGGHPVVSSRKTAAGEEQWFAISGYALFTPIFKSGLSLLRHTHSPAQSEEKKAAPTPWRPSVNKSVSTNGSSDSESDPSSSESESMAAPAVSVEQLRERLSFFRADVQALFDQPQWRFLDGDEKEHQGKLVVNYRRRLKAVDDFWGLTDVDRADLERLIKLIENPMPDDDELSKVDPAAWGSPFLSEPGTRGSASIPLRKTANDQNSSEGDSDSSSESESASNSDSDACDAAKLDVGEYVICRPAQGADEQFWIAQVIADPQNGAGSKSGRVSVHWLEQTNRFTKNKRPFYKQAWTVTATTPNRRQSARQR